MVVEFLCIDNIAKFSCWYTTTNNLRNHILYTTIYLCRGLKIGVTDLGTTINGSKRYVIYAISIPNYPAPGFKLIASSSGSLFSPYLLPGPGLALSPLCWSEGTIPMWQCRRPWLIFKQCWKQTFSAKSLHRDRQKSWFDSRSNIVSPRSSPKTSVCLISLLTQSQHNSNLKLTFH